MYLPPEIVAQLLYRMAGVSANGSFFGADCLNMGFTRFPLTKALLTHMKAKGAPLLFATDKPEKFLQEAGWDTPKVYQLGDPEAHYGRWPFKGSIPRWIPDFVPIPRVWLLSATINNKK